jgi:hypothetical protein
LKLEKDFGKFEFEKKIHVDQLLQANIGKVASVREKTAKMKQEVKKLRK